MSTDWNGFFTQCQNNENLKRFLTECGAKNVKKSMFCPFHENKHTPAASYYVDGNGEHFKCFACDFGGGIFDVFEKARGITDKKELYKQVGDFCGVALPNAKSKPFNAPKRKPFLKNTPAPRPPAPYQPSAAQNENARAFYQKFNDYAQGVLSDAVNAERKRLYLKHAENCKAAPPERLLSDFYLIEEWALAAQYPNAPESDFADGGLLRPIIERRALAAWNAWQAKNGGVASNG